MYDPPTSILYEYALFESIQSAYEQVASNLHVRDRLPNILCAHARLMNIVNASELVANIVSIKSRRSNIVGDRVLLANIDYASDFAANTRYVYDRQASILYAYGPSTSSWCVRARLMHTLHASELAAKTLHEYES